MHSVEERCAMLSNILNTAKTIIQHAPINPANMEAWEHLRFCIRHGYIGFPTESHAQFATGNYLQPGRSERPTNMTEVQNALGLIVCFSEEKMPCKPRREEKSDGVIVAQSAYVSPKDKILVLGYADWYNSFSLAITFLHEARHARHHFGSQFENLSPLDPEELHESRTWKYQLDILDAYGGNMWMEAAKNEANLLKQRYTSRGRSPGEKYFAMSGEEHPTLTQAFGTPSSLHDFQDWHLLLAMRANFLLAEKAGLPDLDTAYANIVGAYYDWSKRQVNKT